MIDPRTIVWVRHRGSTDIDLLLEAPFSGRWIPAHIRIHYRPIVAVDPAVSTTAEIVMSLDSDVDAAYNVEVLRKNGIGVAQDLYERWVDREAAGYTFDDKDRLRIFWPNPQPNVIGWGLEAGLASGDA